MKIVIPLIGGFGKSGGSRVLAQLANYWIKAGHEVYFLSFVNTEPPYYATDATILYYDRVGNIKNAADTTILLPKLRALQLRRSLKKAIEKIDADIILANHCLTAQPVYKAKSSAKKFYYIQAYEPDYFYHRNLKDFIYKRISKKSYSLGLNMIVNAPMYMNYQEIHTDKFVYPGLDLQIYTPDKADKAENKFIFGTIGRSEEYKGTKYIIEAFKKLRQEFGNKVELHVAFGEESLKEIDGVKVLRPDGDDNLAKFYNSLSAYICAGTIQLDAVHYPVIESMACKVPVITTGYLPSSNKNSLIVPVKNSGAIKDAMIVIMEKNLNDFVSQGYEDIQLFSWQEVSSKMLQYFIDNVN